MLLQSREVDQKWFFFVGIVSETRYFEDAMVLGLKGKEPAGWSRAPRVKAQTRSRGRGGRKVQAGELIEIGRTRVLIGKRLDDACGLRVRFGSEWWARWSW